MGKVLREEVGYLFNGSEMRVLPPRPSVFFVQKERPFSGLRCWGRGV